ncbi:MAG TPA: hypothetical protein VIG50_21030, partial [Vicinamibacteria bacterium]
ADGPDRGLRKQAQEAVARPMPPDEVRALHLIADARRAREAGRDGDAVDAYREALRLWPRSREAALGVAEDDLRHGREEAARRAIDDLGRERDVEPAWLRPWSWLLRAEALDVSGERAEALEQYRRVLADPHGREELEERAREGLRRPFTPAPSPPPVG